VFDDSIEIYGFENVELPYFNNNMIKLNVYPSQGDIWINVESSDNEDEEDIEMKSQVFEYIKHLAEKYSIFHWALDGEPI
jgi:hypothetical protein